MKALLCSILHMAVFWAVGLCCVAAARPVHQYTCQPVKQPPGGCGPGCQKAIGTALLQLHAGLKGGEDFMPWHGEGPLGNTLCQEHCHQVPQYCGWAGVLCCHPEHDLHPHRNGASCRGTDVEHEVCPDNTTPGAVWKLDLTMQKLGGSLTDQVVDALKVLTSYGLHAIDFSSNNLSGTIPERLSELGANFTTINLNFNKLTGTIPASIKKLPNLKHVFLSFNKLNGSLDGHFCTKQNDPLEVLILRANFLSGTADLSACTELLLLDLTDNRFTGVVPVGITNTKLVSLRATNNLFSGSIPNDIWKLPLLTTVDLGNNELSGNLSEFVGTSNNLVNIYLGNNSLTGTLPESIVSNSQLLVLELQNNTQLYGIFPSVGALVGLRRLDIHNTSISGSIPEEWGELPYLEYIDISGTRMSCCENQTQADDGPTLPPFLQFSKRFMQFDLNTPTRGARVLDDLEDVSSQPNNILCRTVVRKPSPESEWNKLQLPTINNVVDSQRWQVSPLYFWFDECTCTKFQDKSGTTYRYTGVDPWCDADYNKALNVTPGPCLDMSMFVCEPLSSLLKPGVRAAIAVAAFMFTLIIAGIVAYFLLSKASKVRRFVQLTQVRLKGPPRSGPMTLVVTDIEGYSDIFRRAPEVMFKALVLHNSVLRGAKYHNGGFVLEQEGDSFTIAFYDPFSAVVFCLQVQQALLAVQWPAGLEAVQNPDTSNHTEPGGSRKISKFNMRLSPMLGFGLKLKRVNTNNSTRSVGSNVDYQPSVTHSMFYSNLLQGFGSKENLAQPVLFNGLRVRMGVVTGIVPEGTAIKNSALFQLAKVVGDFGNGGQIILDEATFGAVKEDAQALGAVEASGLNHSKLSSGRSGWNRLLRLCGCSRPNAPAEEVVLLDMGAFCQSRGEEADAELPYTTSRALDVKQPDPQSPGTPSSWWRSLWQPCSPCSPCCQNPEDGLGGDGSDTSPQTSQPLPPAAQLSRPYLGSRPRSGASGSISFGPSPPGGSRGATTGSVSPSGVGQQQHSGELFELPETEASDVAPKQDTAVTGRMASFSLIGAASKQITELRKTFTRSQSWQAGQADARRDWESVRLYQVLPPALAARAHTWHNKMNVKDGWICWDNIYFEAPGSTSAPLTGGSIDMLASSASCTHLSTANSQHLPAASTLSSPASPVGNGLIPTTAAAAAGAGLRLQSTRALSSGEDTSLHVQQTADSDSSSTMTAQGGQSQLGGAGSSGSLQGPQVCNPLLQPLPPVTMVFMAVEGSDQLVRRRRPFTAVVQTLLSRVVRDSLRRLGGYLCRVQEGDMKFMVAFASPVTALEWCLLVQTSAMYLPWPQSAIMLLPSCKEVADSTGRLVFRGPRIKMGVCEGVPRSILPDHEGRADYHGQSINMAARFMDKGARGGQIACTRELAEQVLAVWAAGGGSSSFTNLTHSHLSVTESIAEYQPDSPDVAAAVDATAAADAAGASLQAGFAEGADVQAGSGLQTLDIELSPEPAAAGVTREQVLSTSYSRPARPVSKGPSPVSPSNTASTSAAADAGEGAGPAAAAGAAAGASGQSGVPAKQRATGGSWPGEVISNNNQQQQQQGRQQAQASRYPRLAAHLWLAHSRSSQDGSGHNGASVQRSGSSRLPVTPEGTRALQGQPSGVLDTTLAPAPPPVAPSPFVMKDVVRVPFRVEIHRLGLYQFKGGPPQQEMVQVLPSHLLGRLQFITADIPAPASRKGQLLQRLEGRVAQPVTVQLPVLAQEYHERLPHRVSGTTGLPHRCTSPAASGALDGALPQLGSLAVGQGHGADVFGGRMWGSRSMSLPVRGGLGVPEASAAAGDAAGAGDGRLVGVVHSDPAFDRSAVLAAAAGAEADASRPQSTSNVYSNLSLAVNLTAAELGGCSGAGGKAMSRSSSQSNQQQQQQQGLLDGMYAPSNNQQQLVKQQRQQQGLHEHAGVTAQKQAAGKLSPESAAVAAAESCVLDLQGMVLRHDSFGSVGNAEPDQSSLPTALGDEELGLPAAAGGDGVGRLHGKSDPQLVRSARSSSSLRQSPRG